VQASQGATRSSMYQHGGSGHGSTATSHREPKLRESPTRPTASPSASDGAPIGGGRSRPLDNPGCRCAGDSDIGSNDDNYRYEPRLSHVVTRQVSMLTSPCGRPYGSRVRIARRVRSTLQLMWVPSGVQVDANVARRGVAFGLHHPLEHGWHFGVGSSLRDAGSSESGSPAPLRGVDWHHRRRWLPALGFARG
jgi:hypothetical protein